jgi:hypothetical protein
LETWKAYFNLTHNLFIVKKYREGGKADFDGKDWVAML